MPRTSRASVGWTMFHVINRGDARNDIFHKKKDYAAFLKLMAEACERVKKSLPCVNCDVSYCAFILRKRVSALSSSDYHWSTCK